MTHIEAMKQALEALEKLFGIPAMWTGEGGGDVAVWRLGGSYRAQQAITSLRQAIAEAEGQEKALQSLHAENERLGLYKDAYAEPVIDKSAAIRIATALGWEPKREWVGLTDEQYFEIGQRHWLPSNKIEQIHKEIEAKLKEMNT